MFVKKLPTLLMLLLTVNVEAELPFVFTDGEIASAAAMNSNFEQVLLQIELSKQYFWGAQEEYEVDCSLDEGALTAAMDEGHINILVTAGTCDARSLNTRPVISVRGLIDPDGVKLVTLDTRGELLDMSGFTSDRFYFRDLIFKGAIRSGATWGWLGNVDLNCDTTNWNNYFGQPEQNFALLSYGGLLGVSGSNVDSPSALCGGITSIGTSTYLQDVTITAGKGAAFLANPGSVVIASRTLLQTLDDSAQNMYFLQSEALFFGASEVYLPVTFSAGSSATFAGTTLRASASNDSPSLVNVGSELIHSGALLEGNAQFNVTDSIVNFYISDTAHISMNLIGSTGGIVVPGTGSASVSALNNSQLRMIGNAANTTATLGLGSWVTGNPPAALNIPEGGVTCVDGLVKFSSNGEGITCR